MTTIVLFDKNLDKDEVKRLTTNVLHEQISFILIAVTNIDIYINNENDKITDGVNIYTLIHSMIPTAPILIYQKEIPMLPFTDLSTIIEICKLSYDYIDYEDYDREPKSDIKDKNKIFNHQQRNAFNRVKNFKVNNNSRAFNRNNLKRRFK